MKQLYFRFSLLLLAGCATRFNSYWSVHELVVSPVPVVDLTAADIIESSFRHDDGREAMLGELTTEAAAGYKPLGRRPAA